MMEFIKDLQESRMTRQGQTMRKMTYSDCCENLYLSLLALDIMSKYAGQSPFVRQYAKRSQSLKYDRFRIDSTDLYNFIYFVNGDEEALGKLKDPGNARRLQGRSAFPLRDVQSYLTKMANGQGSFAPQQMFIRLENGLGIKNYEYKEIRRYLVRYDQEPLPVKKNIITKLLFALRAKLRNSDIIDDFSKLVADKDLESNTVKDTEEYPSTADLTTDINNLVYYRYIDKNISLPHIKNFINFVKDGKHPSPDMVKSYMPIIELIDDIIQAGPAYIHKLKVLRSYANKQG